MATRLIKLKDGTLMEVSMHGDQVQQISGGLAAKVDATLDKIKPVLLNACKPITAVWKELNKEMHIHQAEVELGLSFEGEGNLYVTRLKSEANLTVKLVLKPKE